MEPRRHLWAVSKRETETDTENRISFPGSEEQGQRTPPAYLFWSQVCGSEPSASEPGMEENACVWSRESFLEGFETLPVKKA